MISTLGDILRMIFSEDGRGSTRGASRKRKDGYVEYSSISDGGSRRKSDPTRQDFRKIRLEFYEREDAEEVLGDLRERLESSNADCIPVRDLYSLADLPTNATMKAIITEIVSIITATPPFFKPLKVTPAIIASRRIS